jgi:medium-chain acyl-[acyl-carrier-protein] hydrolase
VDSLTDRIDALPAAKRTALLQRLRERPEAAPPPADWIVPIRTSAAARFRLFCFPYAGGGAAAFRTWENDLPEDVEVYAVRYPGRESRIADPACRRMPGLLDGLVPAIAPWLDRPFAFYGHSMGALVAFELARWLRRAGGPQPSRLLLAAFRAPHLPNPHIKIYHLPDEVLKVVLRTDGTPQRILDSDELMSAMLPTLRADFELCDTYEYLPVASLDCPMTVFGGTEDERVSLTDLDGWAMHTSSSCEFVHIPGGHFFLHSAQGAVATSIARNLRRDWAIEGEASHA